MTWGINAFLVIGPSWSLQLYIQPSVPKQTAGHCLKRFYSRLADTVFVFMIRKANKWIFTNYCPIMNSSLYSDRYNGRHSALMHHVCPWGMVLIQQSLLPRQGDRHSRQLSRSSRGLDERRAKTRASHSNVARQRCWSLASIWSRNTLTLTTWACATMTHQINPLAALLQHFMLRCPLPNR